MGNTEIPRCVVSGIYVRKPESKNYCYQKKKKSRKRTAADKLLYFLEQIDPKRNKPIS